jgi:hypothetical protein
MVEIAVWHESARIGHEEAAQRYEQLAKMAKHPSLPAFHAELTQQLPGLQIKGDKKSHLRIFAEAKAVARIRYVAAKHKLVCFNPEQQAVVNPPLLRRFDAMDLATDTGLPIEDPSPAHVAQAAASLSDDNWFMTLEVDDDHFLQCGFGRRAGAAPGEYVVEYREGDSHLQTRIADVEQVIAVFTEQIAGSSAWRADFSWTPVNVS